MDIVLNKYHPHKLVKSLASQLNTSSKVNCLEEIIDLNDKYGEGKITGFLFSDGLSFVLFDCLLEKDINIKFSNNDPAPLVFNFTIEGEVMHSLNSGNIQYHNNALQGTITACPIDSTQDFTLPGKRKIIFASLMIDRKLYLEKIDCIINNMPDKLSNVFSDVESKEPFFYQGNYSLAASSCIKKIINDENDGLVRSTYIEAKVLELLSKQVKQFKDDLLDPGNQKMLRDYDVQKIEKARDILISDLQNPPIIVDLAKKAGINQQKLKQGFKIIFDSTINNYLRNERLELASIILLKGASVREAALEVGYINQSHFARRFKEKYGVLPKDYLKSIKAKTGGRAY